MNQWMKKIEGIPVPLLPTMVGTCTLANVYQGLGYEWVRALIFICATILLLCYLYKIICYPKTCAKEYSNTVPCSLYGGFSMLMMLVGSFFFPWVPLLGRTLWLMGVAIHAAHIIVFLWRNVFRGIKIDTFLPSWFVTLNGIMVATVSGVPMGYTTIANIVIIWGILAFTVTIPFMIYRLVKHPVSDAVCHTQAVVLAPCSLCVVSYLNWIKNPNPYLLLYLYGAVLCALVFIIYKLPKFFSLPFTPGYAGLTFPMAIGIIASNKMSVWVTAQGNELLGNAIRELAGFQIFLTTAIIGFVLFNFLRMFARSLEK